MAGLVVRTAVREAAGDMRVSADFFDALDKVVADKVKAASSRATGNGRQTLKPVDV